MTTVYLAGLYEEEIATGTSRSHYTLDGKVVAQRSRRPNEVLYLHSDHLGSVSALTDTNGLPSQICGQIEQAREYYQAALTIDQQKISTARARLTTRLLRALNHNRRLNSIEDVQHR